MVSRRCLKLYPPPPSILGRLSRGGYVVTLRCDGLYNIENYGTSCSAQELLDLWCWMEIWPGGSGLNGLAPQRLCGGGRAEYLGEPS